jgi:transposase
MPTLSPKLRPVHVKTLRSQKLRMLLTHRKLLQSKAIAIENDLRGTIKPHPYHLRDATGIIARIGQGHERLHCG